MIKYLRRLFNLTPVIQQVQASDWIEYPDKVNIGCCDCGLFHTYRFRMNADTGAIMTKGDRNVKMTERVRNDRSRRFPYQLVTK